MVDMKRIVISAGVLLFLAFPLIPAWPDVEGTEKRNTLPKVQLTILYSANTRGTVKPYG